MKTLVLQTETRALFNQAVARAAQVLREGKLAALPTETVYGLAANAWDSRAVAQIFAVKGRPGHNPVIVHVSSIAMACQCVTEWTAQAGALAARFWPGPLTLVLPRSEKIPANVTAGGPTVGIRWPSHPLMRAVIAECGFPLAAPSANPANQLSPTTAAHVLKYFDGKIPLIVDGGASQVGIESTVIDLTVSPPRVLRPGMASVEAFLSESAKTPRGLEPPPLSASSNKTLRSPGMLDKHYSPKAKLRVLRWRDESDLSSQLSGYGVPPAKIHIVAHDRIPMTAQFGRVSVIPHDAEAFARALYSELHRCDEEGAELIIVEELPAGEPWRAIADRLKRAAGSGSV
jgi:L-threonylcarbamoyladenylate synthase